MEPPGHCSPVGEAQPPRVCPRAGEAGGSALIRPREVSGSSGPITPPATAAPSQVWLGTPNKAKSPRKFRIMEILSAEFLCGHTPYTFIESHCIVHLIAGECLDMRVTSQQRCEMS